MVSTEAPSRACTPAAAEGSDELAAVRARVDELERLIDEGRDEAVPAIAEQLAELGERYAQFDAAEARALWDRALEYVDHAIDGPGAGACGRVWQTIASHRVRSGDAGLGADAYGSAAEAYRRAIVLAPSEAILEGYLYAENELGVYHDARAGQDLARKHWDSGIAMLARHPELPPTLTHARLFLNRGMVDETCKRTTEAIEDLDHAIAIYERLIAIPQARVELARALHRRSALRDAPSVASADELRALAVLEPVLGHLNGKREATLIHHVIGLRLREQGRFAAALPHQTAAVELMYDVVELAPSPEAFVDLATYRAARTLALGGARSFAAAVEEANEVIAELEARLGEHRSVFGQTLLRQLREKLPAWTEASEAAVRRANRTEPEADQFACTFCKRWKREVKKLISGPRVFICDQCVTLCLDILEKDWPKDPVTKERRGTPKPAELPCGFCAASERRAFITGPDGAVICDDCVDLCVEIIDEEIRATEGLE